VALALVMIYQATHHINFAQGEMATFSTFIAWALIRPAGPTGPPSSLTVAVSFAGGLLMQRIVLKPIEKAPVLTNVIVFIGLLLIFNALSGMDLRPHHQGLPQPVPKDSAPGDASTSRRTSWARPACCWWCWRAVRLLPLHPAGPGDAGGGAEPRFGRLVGIRVSWMLALGWGLAAAIGAVAGMMVAPSSSSTPT
jgi:branched-chain amino acid transport system permease protein